MYPTAVIDEHYSVGRGTKIWHFTHVMKDSILGENCNLGRNAVISPGGKLGKNVKVHNNVSIYTGVTWEDDVFRGPYYMLTNITNPRRAVARRGDYARTTEKKGSSIGANATIVCGLDIGCLVFVGAGAVVTINIPDDALVIGNPARHVGWMSEYGQRLRFNEEGQTQCRESGEKYTLHNNKVKKV